MNKKNHRKLMVEITPSIFEELTDYCKDRQIFGGGRKAGYTTDHQGNFII